MRYLPVIKGAMWCTDSANWRPMMVLSLGLISVAGLQALSFWVLRADFSLTWWLPNAWLLLFPIPAIWVLFRIGAVSRTRSMG